MGVSKQQRVKIEATCECGCGELFFPFPVYGQKGEGLIYPKYKRGHHPNNRVKGKTAWNKGLTKDICPTLAKMGYQPGHKPYNDWSKVNYALKNDRALYAKWLSNKRGKVAWNKGKKKDDYQNGIASGEKHGNWKGGKRGDIDTATYAVFSCYDYWPKALLEIFLAFADQCFRGGSRYMDCSIMN